jgi:hypothetical protein
VVRAGRVVTFDAALRPDELLERTGIAVPEDSEYETIAGYVTCELDRMPPARSTACPKLGDEVAITGGAQRVERVDGSRIGRLRTSPVPTKRIRQLSTVLQTSDLELAGRGPRGGPDRDQVPVHQTVQYGFAFRARLGERIVRSRSPISE